LIKRGINGPQLSNVLAQSVLCAHKLTTTRRALEKSSCSQGLNLEQGVAYHPPDPHWFFLFSGGDSWLFGPMYLFFLNCCREWSHCLRSFSFLSFLTAARIMLQCV